MPYPFDGIYVPDTTRVGNPPPLFALSGPPVTVASTTCVVTESRDDDYDITIAS